MRTIALGLAVFSLAAAVSAADIQKLKKIAKAHKELALQGHANFKDNTCESRGPPIEIDLNIPPKGGTLCMRSGMVRVQYTWSGRNQNCIGKRISGVFVIYIPFGGFTGLDTMQYTVRGAQPVTRTYEAEIRVEAGQATAAGASSAPSEPQKAGPMPACPALVS
jgi:hypothetical protein